MLGRLDLSRDKDSGILIDFLNKRNIGENEELTSRVSEIIRDIRLFGDAKLFYYTKLFDCMDVDEKNIKVSERDIDEAYKRAEPAMLCTIRKACSNIKEYHEKQKTNEYFIRRGNSTVLGQLTRPLEKVGIYVPGGRAPLPSSVLMNAIPAKIAGVGNIIMATPPKNEGINDYVLIAAKEAGVDSIYRMGGAQAIAAMAYGTDSIPRVDKITGPGNDYVALAKKLVYGACDIDMIAGPSEICIIADENARPDYIAADLLSQAEHDPNAALFLITTKSNVIDEVEKALKKQLLKISRRDVAAEAIARNGKAILTEDMDNAIETANIIAPEHLELMISEGGGYVSKIKNAGAIFIGDHSPEPAGDYLAGTNHVLPTCGTARFSSPLGVRDFVKCISYINYGREDLRSDMGDIIRFAMCEGLDAHAASVSIRFGEKNDRKTC
jgi:histidinol dehydrogenase